MCCCLCCVLITPPRARFPSPLPAFSLPPPSSHNVEHINPENIVLQKGCMACELSTGDELLLTELVFNNFFTDLDSAQTAALLSVLVFNPPQQKGGKAPPRLRDELDSHLNEMKETARRVGTVLKEAKVDIDVQEYIDKIQPGIAEVVYQWAQGKPFREVCDVTKEFEGCVRVCVCVCVCVVSFPTISYRISTTLTVQLCRSLLFSLTHSH